MLKKISLLLLISCCLIIGLLTIVNYFVNKPYNYSGSHPKTTGNTISILLLDGLSQTIFEENLAANKLPNLKKLIQTGTYIKNGIGAFPSMTGYAFYPFITGKDASTSGIYGLRWFDRNLEEGNLRNYVGRTNIHMNRDINPQQKNIFELSGDQYTCSINSYMNKGVKESALTGWRHTTSKFEHTPLFRFLAALPYFGNRITADFFEHETYAMNLAKKQLAHNPKIQWVTLPSLDAMNHIHGTTTDYSTLLIHVDSLIGDFIQSIDNLGQSETRALAIITDHGISDVHQNIDLRKSFKRKLNLDLERGKSVHLLTDALTIPLSEFENKDGYFVINGNLSAYLYLRNPLEKETKLSWRKKLLLPQLQAYSTPKGGKNILDFLAQQEGIGLLTAQQNDSTIWVQLAEQIGVITKHQNAYSYIPLNGDPLGYTQDTLAIKLLNDKFHTASTWPAHTIETDYPDAIYRLYELMSKPEVGDLLICSKKGYDLAADYELFVGNYKVGMADCTKIY
ncbi:MAG: alkaline phosphatase family protein [Saprospiraceae bacterium]